MLPTYMPAATSPWS